MWVGLTVRRTADEYLALDPVTKQINKIELDVSFYDLPTREPANAHEVSGGTAPFAVSVRSTAGVGRSSRKFDMSMRPVCS
jgi:hypothetical protein